MAGMRAAGFRLCLPRCAAKPYPWPLRHSPAIRSDVRPRTLRKPGRRQEARARPGAGAPADAARCAGAARRRASLGAPDPSRSAGCSAAATQDEPAKGLYIFGDVGRGKTMLMDLFFEASPVVRKRRAHFHEFMADVHERVRGFRQQARRTARSRATMPSGSPPARSPRRAGCSASTNSTSPTSPTP